MSSNSLLLFILLFELFNELLIVYDLDSLSSLSILLIFFLCTNSSSYVSLNDSVFSSDVVSFYIHEFSFISVEILSI